MRKPATRLLTVALIGGTQGALVRNNTMNTSAGEGVYIFNSNGNRVENNSIGGVSESAIYLEGSSNNILLGNGTNLQNSGTVTTPGPF